MLLDVKAMADYGERTVDQLNTEANVYDENLLQSVEYVEQQIANVNLVIQEYTKIREALRMIAAAHVERERERE